MTNATRPACFSAKRPSPWTIRHVRSRPFIPSGHRSVARTGRPAGTTGRRIALLASMLVLGVQPYGHAQATQNESSYAGGYLVTGDYAVASVDVTSRTNGFATGTIQMTGVPNNADVLAAFMSWETVTSPTGDASGVQFRGFNIDVAAVRQASRLLGPDTPCYGPTGGGSTMTMFRADVLQFLPFQQATGKRLANGAHAVRLPAAGTGSNRTSRAPAPRSSWCTATTPSRFAGSCCTTASPFSGPAPRSRSISRGSTNPRPHGRRGSRTSSGADSRTTRRRSPSMAGSSKTNPFQSLGSSSERGWSTNTVADVSRFMPGSAGSEYGETAVTSVSHSNSSPYECLAWAAVVFSTAVEDVDHDGLPDGLETAQLRDPAAICCPICRRWAPRRRRRTCSSRSTRCGRRQERPTARARNLRVDVTGHHHLPSPQVLKLVGDAYKNAPVLNPDGTTGIRAHFDVGSVAAYHGLGQVHHESRLGGRFRVHGG